MDFDKLEIIEETDEEKLTVEEERLNEMISVFNDYLSRSFNFDDKNTQQLIEGSSIQHLDMPKETLKMIIDAYFDV